jgi:hypothetical protein
MKASSTDATPTTASYEIADLTAAGADISSDVIFAGN